jgi:hypothetical protein
MNKKIRRYREYLKYKNRIERFVANGSYVFIKSDETRGMRTYHSGDFIRIDKPTVNDIMKDGGWNYYKHTSTPCSCSMCAYDKYKRHEQKIENRKLIKEGLDMED